MTTDELDAWWAQLDDDQHLMFLTLNPRDPLRAESLALIPADWILWESTWWVEGSDAPGVTVQLLPPACRTFLEEKAKIEDPWT
jgi:hypothetical protein